MCNAVCGNQKCFLREWHSSPHSFEQRTGKRACSVVKYTEPIQFIDDEDTVELNCKRPRGRAPNGTNGIPKTWMDGEGWVETLSSLLPPLISSKSSGILSKSPAVYPMP